ncbi:hypothetical protein J7E97_08025 [Streptomyces sp. ISL-66]|uniref:hypothetical protein n=1 Tax=Streptomyces sp. ISL-66 TaxID=2819186 RepID=UPI001BE65DAA|nr:hypothetical protein [Streptomyces sp. ISL-66]MBT2467820.1 hypothetical protein [Streptomyces sp. ISL-66]
MSAPAAQSQPSPVRRLIAAGIKRAGQPWLVEQPTMTQTGRARHAIAAFARTSSGKQRLIRAAAEEYLSQIDRRRLPVGYGRAILDDYANRIDAYEMRQGHVFTKMLGLSIRPGDAALPEIARTVLAAADATVEELVSAAKASGDPAGLAVAWIVSAAASHVRQLSAA